MYDMFCLKKYKYILIQKDSLNAIFELFSDMFIELSFHQWDLESVQKFT